MTARFAIVLLLCLIGFRQARAEGSLTADGHLDTMVVRDAYLRSDIPFVRSALEAYLKNHPKDVSVAEKVFTHLYLGATFAGDPEGRGRSEAHFRAALKIAPEADPAGLYLPPSALVWFESLRAEARAARKAAPAPGMASAGNPSDGKATGADASAPASVSPGKSRGWLRWAIGGGVAVAAGVGAIAWIETRSEPSPHRVQVDATLP